MVNFETILQIIVNNHPFSLHKLSRTHSSTHTPPPSPVNCSILSYQSPSTFLFYGSVSADSYVLERVVLVCSFARL